MHRPTLPLLSSVVALADNPAKQKEMQDFLDEAKIAPNLQAGFFAGLNTDRALYHLGRTYGMLAEECKTHAQVDDKKAQEYQMVCDALTILPRKCFEKTYGNCNTSVTTGIAYGYLTNPGDQMGQLNCGTGGVKYQQYTLSREDGIVADEEFKPESVSLSAVVLPDGLYTPSASHTTHYTVSQAADLIATDMKKCNVDGVNRKWCAAITGELRQAYEATTPENKVAMDAQMKLLFQGPELAPFGILPWKGGSYFITQEEEGIMEICAVAALIKAIDPESEGVLGKGTGKGTTQIVGKTLDLDESGIDSHGLHVIKFPSGLLKPENYKDLPGFVVDDFKSNYDTFALPFARKVCSVAKPVFGDKSGFLLALEQCPKLKDMLTSADDYVASLQVHAQQVVTEAVVPEVAVPEAAVPEAAVPEVVQQVVAPAASNEA